MCSDDNTDWMILRPIISSIRFFVPLLQLLSYDDDDR